MKFATHAVAGAVAWICLTATTYAQLSDEEIAALRQEGKANGWTFAVRKNPATERPLSELCGLVVPPDWRVTSQFDDRPARLGLPESFDWRDYNGCTPIRNQGGCGSCWAFGAIGAMECAIRIGKGISVNLSEQWLVSCTSAGDCGGGWHFEALDYLTLGGLLDPCGDGGAVLESDFPYRASNVACGCPYPHPYALTDWMFVGPQWGIASVDQLKQAILDHGPVATCVYVNNAFQAYGGGVFNACESDWINHVVVLVGWDDTQGTNGVWFLRNSWGTGWGEAGYMRIAYGCSEIGYATCRVEYDPADCNNNGLPDSHEIASGAAADCNGNNVPDECDVDPTDPDHNGNVSPDCNTNTIPDECELDGDHDGAIDDCDPDDDNDAIPDDGDNSGTIGDNPCTGGQTANCDDNCRLSANTGQADADVDGAGDICDACPNTIPGVSVDTTGCPLPIPGDFNADGDVDLEDFGHLQACFTGMGNVVTNPDCLDARLDGDVDVDADDFVIFKTYLSGPHVPADPPP